MYRQFGEVPPSPAPALVWKIMIKLNGSHFNMSYNIFNKLSEMSEQHKCLKWAYNIPSGGKHMVKKSRK